MKKMNTNKIVSIVVLVAVLVATVAGAYLGIMGRNTQMVTVTENGVESERALYRQVAFIPNPINETWKEAIVPSAQLGGGLSYILTADQGDMSDADFAKVLKSAAKIAGERVEMVSGDAAVSLSDSEVTITVPVKDYDSLVDAVAATPGAVTFCLYDSTTGLFGEPVLTNEHVKDAGYYSDNSAYYLQAQLNKKGQKALSSFAADHNGEVLYVLLDGNYVGYFYLSTTMDTQYISATVDDWTYALLTAVCLRTDVLPISLAMSNYADAEATLGGLLDGVVVVMGIVTLLAAVWMIIRGKTAGLVSVLSLCAQGVVYCLCVALIAVSAAWKLTLSALIMLCICQLLFIAGLVLVNESVARGRKHRGFKQAAAAAMKKNVKPLAIVYGALVVLGVLLMGFFSATPAGYLGRMVALSGVVSFVVIFVAQRVLLSCASVIKSK